MTVVYYDLKTSEHIKVEAIKIEESISDAELEMVYFEGTTLKSMIIEKQFITSINAL